MRLTIFENLSTKFVAVLLALGVWLVVSAPRRERTVERAYGAPLALIGVPRDLIITTQVQDTVNVRVRGRLSAIRAISSSNLEATVDLSASQPGEFVVTIRPQALNAPPGIEVLSVEPNKIRFRLERLRQKSVPIRAFLVGSPPIGFAPGDPVINPSEALVSGPASQVKDLTEVATERIIMTGRAATFMQNVGVVSDIPLVRIVEPSTAQVTVPVIEAQEPAGSEKSLDPAALETKVRPEKKMQSKKRDEPAASDAHPRKEP